MVNLLSPQTVPIHFMDATLLAELIRTKKLKSVEVVQAHLDRIALINPKINAIVTLISEHALQAALLADKSVQKGDSLGPLHGVPFTIKDAIDTAEVPSQRGSKLFEGFIPDSDATAVARFKNAGGIPLAKTNIPEFSAWFETDNLLSGLTRNPWNLERTPGGSSGGESAAIAAGLSPIGIGSDVAISVRGPAAFTGISALKATHGRIPYTGHFPTALSRYWHIGPMARTVNDVKLGYSILNGEDGIDGYAVHANDLGEVSLRTAGRQIRVGVVSESVFAPVDPEVMEAVRSAATRLLEFGCAVEEVQLPILKKHDWVANHVTLLNGEIIPYIKKIAAGRESQLHPVAAYYAAAEAPSLNDYLDAQNKVEELRSAFVQYFERYDVLLCPVIPFTASIPNQESISVNGETVSIYHMMSATAPFNMTGLPALSVPFAFSREQLPINVQLISRWLDEATILQLGSLIERADGRHPDL